MGVQPNESIFLRSLSLSLCCNDRDTLICATGDLWHRAWTSGRSITPTFSRLIVGMCRHLHSFGGSAMSA
jgi:hypothetical protein